MNISINHTDLLTRFILTMWNVNKKKKKDTKTLQSCFILTMWNVN